LPDPALALFSKPAWLKASANLSDAGEELSPTASRAAPGAQPLQSVTTTAADLFLSPPWLKAGQELAGAGTPVPATATDGAPAPSPQQATTEPAPELFTVASWLKPRLEVADEPVSAATSTSTGGRSALPRRATTAARPAADVSGRMDLIAGALIAVGAPSPAQVAVTADALGLASRSRTSPGTVTLSGARDVGGLGASSGGAQDGSLTMDPSMPSVAGSRAAVSFDEMPALTQGDVPRDASSKRDSPMVDDRPAAEGEVRTGISGLAATPSGPASVVDLGLAMSIGAAAADRALPAGARAIQADLHSPHWPREVAAELVTLGNQKLESATLRVSPEHLGPIEVHIHLEAKVVNLTFGAAHEETRTALEQALPQLRDGFAQAGLTLGQATVQQQMRQESQNHTLVPTSKGDAVEEVIAKSESRQALSLIDEYA
jgi:flagellar hook-length control protein FliK